MKGLDTLSPVQTPASIRWAEEARKGRRRLYPMTAVYSAAATAALVYALRSNPWVAPWAWLLGVAFWTWVEYMVHRYILHGVFPDGPGLQHWGHKFFDHLHVQHHLRPWDGSHINGTIKDTGPFLLPVASLGLLLPAHTLLASLAGLVQAYVVEEWIHHSVHFYHFHNPYFRYIKRHHQFHHSRRGDDMAFGLTNAFWDVVYGTRIPVDVRAALHGRERRSRPLPGA
jgi:sterol desaturase/sphingolipid hydroxylase (fatty acid hydroxylase superfamily)